MKYLLAIFLIILFSTPCISKQSGWIDEQGNLIENTDSMKTIKGFGGWLLITSDKNWKEKWDTPTSHVPNFNIVKEVKRGEQISILPLFKNATLSDKNRVQLTCDIKIVDPKSEVSFEQADMECFDSVVKENKNIMLAYTVIDIIAEYNDPLGEWNVYFNFNDKNSNITIPLRAKFTILE